MLKKKTIIQAYKEVVEELLNNDPIASYCLFENRVKYNNVLLGNIEVLNYLLDVDIIIDWDDLSPIYIGDTQVSGGYLDVNSLVDEIVLRLDKLFHKDSIALHNLWINITPCSQSLLEHPIICVDKSPVLDDAITIGLPQILYSLLLRLKSETFVCLNWERLDDEQNKLIGFTTYTVS